MKILAGFKSLKTGEIWENPLWACGVFLIVFALLNPTYRNLQDHDIQEKTKIALADGWQAYAERTDPAKARLALHHFSEAARLSPTLLEPKSAWLITYFDVADRQELSPQSAYTALDISNELITLFKHSSLPVVQSFLVLANTSTDLTEKKFALNWAENILKNRVRAGANLNAHHLYLQGRLKLLRAQVFSDPKLAEAAIPLFEAASAKEPHRLRNLFWHSMAYRWAGQISVADEKLRELLQLRGFLEEPPEAQWIYSKAHLCLEKKTGCLSI